MSRNVSNNVQSERDVPFNLLVDNFKGGLVTLLDQSIAPQTSVVSALNMMMKQDGRWSTRWGTQYYGATAGGTITAFERYVPASGASHIVAIVNTGANSVVKRSTDNGATWDTVTGATLTNGHQPYFIQSNNYLYISNSYDNVVRYDGSTTLVVFAALTTPTWAGTPFTRGSGLTTGSYGLFYKISAVNSIGETIATSELVITSGVSIRRDNWKNDPTTADTQLITLAWTTVSGAERYNIYVSEQSTAMGGVFSYLDSTSDLFYPDNGKAPINTLVVAPTVNTTQGPKFGPMELSGNRIWATTDKDNPWRVWWSGSFPHMGAFSPDPIYDGGYVDLDLGGAERPIKVIHYRDGRGGSFATVLTSDPEGNGSIWQIDLQTISVGNFSYTQPVPTKIVGSIGTVAPLSVVKVKNDIMFVNRKGVFTLGSRAQMLNLLSTDEISANIRPDIRSLTGSAISGIAGIYYDAKVFYSVPYGSATNNVIYVNDTERRNWAGPWTVGVTQFLVYADTTGANHLLGITGGDRIIELKEGIAGDLGVAFETSLITGLIPVNPRDRRQFAKVKRAYMELNQPIGNIQFSVLGVDRKGNYTNLNTFSLLGTLSGAGYGTEQFSTNLFSDTSIAPGATSSVIVRKFMKVNRKLNNVQFKLTTTDIGASYTLISFQAQGDMRNDRDPSHWKS